MAVKSVKIKLVKSTVGRLKKHKACVSGLGLRRIGDEVEVVIETLVNYYGETCLSRERAKWVKVWNELESIKTSFWKQM